MSEIVDPDMSKITQEERRGKARNENKSKLTATIDHLPILAREANGYPRSGGTVGHGNVTISISLLLLGGDEDLKILGRVHDGNREGRPNPETGVKLLPALLLEDKLTFLLDLERGAHVRGYRELVEIGLWL
jgi:hypothetical protein